MPPAYLLGVLDARLPFGPPDARVLVFGGTFDPPHRGHVEQPPRARLAVDADWVLYVPAARSPHKEGGPEADGGDRVRMLRAALAGVPRTSVSTIELDRAADGDPSWTIDTIRELRRLAPAATRFELLIGDDQARGFHRWRGADELLALAPPRVMLRSSGDGGAELARTLAGHWPPDRIAWWRSRVVELPILEVEATRIRSLLDGPRTDAARRELRASVPDAVLEVIDRRGLYRRPRPAAT